MSTNRSNIITKKITIVLVGLFICAGFLYRLNSINQGLSYWNDESNAAIFARGIIEYGAPVTATGVSLGVYEVLLFYTTAFSYALLGVTEFSGRLPSVLAGTILIAVIAYITTKITDHKTALIAAFLATFSTIQLAWSTQLRPYIWLQLFILPTIYYLYLFIQNKTKFWDKNIFLSLLFTLFASLFHGTGMMSIIIISFAVVYKAIRDKKLIYILAPLPVVFLGLVATYYSIRPSFANVYALLTGLYTDITHYRVYLGYHYLWLCVGAAIGCIGFWKKNKELTILLTGSITIIIALAIFKINPRYVRYSLPAFPLLYILFAYGQVWLSEIMAKKLRLKYSSLIILTIILVLFLTWPLKKGKIALQPRAYYSINADMRENPIVDYKSAFMKIEKLIGDREDIIMMDAWNDRIPWYLPGQTFVWINRTGKGELDPHFGEKIISTPQQFEAIKKQYPAGIVIVENWESQTSPEMQDYIRSTLKEEFGEQTVKGNEQDSWSITVYSWGL